MKIKSVFSICNKGKRMLIMRQGYAEEDVCIPQWIGTGYAMYLTENLPPLDKNMVMAIFDVPEKQREEWEVAETPLIDALKDPGNNDEIAERLPVDIAYKGRMLRVLHASSGIALINNEFLAPLSDALGQYELFMRESENGRKLIVAKVGFFTQAVIAPITVSKELAGTLEIMARLCGTEQETENPSGVLQFNRETGEITEL